MASIKIPSQAEIEQFIYEIDTLEGYSYAEWLDWMEEAYPNVDAQELYASKGENIVTGYRDIKGNFVAGEPPEIDPDIQALIEAQPIGIDRMNAEIEASAKELDEMSQAEKSALFMATLRDKALNPEKYETVTDNEAINYMTDEQVHEAAAVGEQWKDEFKNLISQGFLVGDTEEIAALEDTPIDPLDPMQLGDMIVKYSEDAGIAPEAGMLIAAGLTKNPKILSKKDGMISSKNSKVLKSKSDEEAFKDRISSKAKGPRDKTAKTISTKNSTILKEKTPTVSTSNSRVLREKGPDVSNKNSKVIKPKDSANVDIAKAANVTKVKNIRDARKNLSNKDKLVAGGITGAATIAALTNNTGLKGNRGADGSLMTADNESFDIPILGEDVVTSPSKTRKASKGSAYKDMPPAEKARQTLDIAPKSNTKPGWKQAPDGNYWSADFEDEYWNTPAGVQEAIGVWGRPIGSRIGNPITWEGWN